MSKTKTYVSGSILSFNVVKEGAQRHTHISFSPLTLSGSMYTTSDEALQRAIESHRLFRCGTIRISSEIPIEEKNPVSVPPSGTEAAAVYGSTTFAPVVEKKPESRNDLSFGSLAEAKDYLADQYGVSRTKLRTKAAIESAAKENGVTITWN